MSYLNVQYCVKSVLHELNATTTTEYHRLTQLGFRIYRDLNLFVGMPNLKTVYLPVNANMTIDLPDDFVDYRAVAICVNGRLITLSLDNSLCLRHNINDCCELEAETLVNPDTGISQPLFPYWYMFLPTWRNGNYVGEDYSATGDNYAGYFRVDYNNRQIQFNSLIPQTEIALEYVSNGIDCDGQAIVPDYAVEPMITGIHWKNIQNDRTISLGEKDRAKQDYFIQYEKAMMFVNQARGQEWKDNWLDSVKSVPKR